MKSYVNSEPRKPTSFQARNATHARIHAGNRAHTQSTHVHVGTHALRSFTCPFTSSRVTQPARLLTLEISHAPTIKAVHVGGRSFIALNHVTSAPI